MKDVNQLMQEEFLPFYKRAADAFEYNHPALYSVINSFMVGKQNQIGLRITENERVLGDYTLYLDGAKIARLDNGVLAPQVHTPFGNIKPYVILEKSTVQRMIEDEQNFIENPFATKLKYIPETTIKFLK